MRKARRTAEMQQDPGPPMPYPQYGYPPPSGPTHQDPSMYMTGPPAAMYNPAAQAASPGYYPQQGMPYMGMPMSGEQNNFSMPTQLLQNPAVANMAMQYGQSLMGQGKEALDRELNKYVATSRVKYYFSVDTAYVAKKLMLLLFPFTHRDWSIKYNPDEPVQPRYEVNAPDLYIPVMAFVTYVLIGGVSLGLQERFSPEALGIQASTALVWAIIEVVAIVVTLYVMNLQTKLTSFDIVAFSSYKYVGMIFAILVSFVVPSAYHLALIYVSSATMFFLIRSLKVQILPEPSNAAYGVDSSFAGEGSKRRTYLLLFMAGIQPLLIWWLTRQLARP
uniref:Protein YIF1 n=1 Tax=Ceriodaphnia reticulata TaxID=302197 RepID=A0A4Y7M011_9CRUS|nr:EOG090X0ATU [Ceriodaphnia reticulata]SVE73115.1 EOG090X0ATU [Ceriodaphnia reticulata]